MAGRGQERVEEERDGGVKEGRRRGISSSSPSARITFKNCFTVFVGHVFIGSILTVLKKCLSFL